MTNAQNDLITSKPVIPAEAGIQLFWFPSSSFGIQPMGVAFPGWSLGTSYNFVCAS
ncbi:MAG: hypothetical protein JRG97_13930 [Deltaproteobacteria bacterium]|nr:hypothetical protein [Deltaproteobacteria bacterium]MBW2142141.1 hypothetical protein [Deltaproteobacteria bacterium]